MDHERERRRARLLLRAFAAGDEEARLRAATGLAGREQERFVLSDALHVVAREEGFRSWPDLVHARPVCDADEDVDPERARAARVALRDLPDGGEVTVAVPGAVAVRVRQRGYRVSIDDDGNCVREAGYPTGWREVAERVVAAQGMNVNRTGVVFVPAVADRDVAPLVVRLADTAAAVRSALLDLEADE
jgi:hypothetical protein